MNPFDDKRLYLNPIQSLSWDKYTQKGDCPCIYCLKLIGLFYRELSTRDGKPIRYEEIYYNIWTLKKNESSRPFKSDKRYGTFIVITGVTHAIYNFTIIIDYYDLLSSFIIIPVL